MKSPHAVPVPPDLRRTLFVRIGSASAMVFLLLGGLLIDNYLNTPSTARTEAEPPPQFTEPVPIAKKTLIAPPTPSETLAELQPGNEEKSKPDATEAFGKPNDSQRDSMVQPRQTMPEKKLVDAPTETPRYALQAAVNFTDPRAAEDLRARLLQEEIPSALDIHVQIGPFQTRKESDSAREKLKTLGIAAVALPPKGKKQQVVRKSAPAKPLDDIATDPP